MTPKQIKNTVEKFWQRNLIKTINEVNKTEEPSRENNEKITTWRKFIAWCRDKRTEKWNLKKNTPDQIH